MSSQRSPANAVGGKTARACDSCMRRRARWYCAADDAFLCQTCDASVHSANPLARRHDRVRLKTSSSKSALPTPPAWHHGFKRKARTPRHAKGSAAAQTPSKPAPVTVPDMENNGEEEEEEEEEEEQLLYCVPIFDPVLEELYSTPAVDEVEVKPATESQAMTMVEETDVMISNVFAGFNPSDMELAEFAADMESLLGQGMEDDSFCIEEDKNQVKVEEADCANGGSNNNNTEFLVGMEMEFNFECRESSAATAGEGEEEMEEKVTDSFSGERNNSSDNNNNCYDCNNKYNNKVGLKLNYEAVMTEWSCSPWTDGERPQFNPDHSWSDFMGIWGVGEVQGGYGEGKLLAPIGQVGGNNDDGGREARVSRYREKRRTRLFSKKIRYEVRKLNAEKRPRMKGRFVKRTSISPAVPATGPSFSYV